LLRFLRFLRFLRLLRLRRSAAGIGWVSAVRIA
jgi:hypothetical protein